LKFDKGTPPPEYSRLQLCKVYHCLPSQLAQESYLVIQEDIAMLNLEGGRGTQKSGQKATLDYLEKISTKKDAHG